MKLLLCFLPFFGWCLEANYSIVFIHLGKKLPAYLEVALAQARLFNKECPIILIANEQALKQANLPDFKDHPEINIMIACESLPPTEEHEAFNQNTKLRSGFWRFTSERFLYLNDFMTFFGSKNVFHLENDVMLYINLEKMLPLFQLHYPAIATTFENKRRCIPGFVYISNPEAMRKLARHFAKKASQGMNDMKLIADYKKNQGEIACLPMIMEQYLYDNTASSFNDLVLKKQLDYSKHIQSFNSIFDGAAIGVFIGGWNPQRGSPLVYKSLFQAEDLCYEWEEDEEGRKIPFAIYKNEKYRINNLHIASKYLKLFKSR